LLEAAARVIARDGFQGARLADVAREAGLTTGAVYSNFRDKEELFLAAFDEVQGMGVVDEQLGFEEMIASFREQEARWESSRQLQVLNLELALLGARDSRIRRVLREGLATTIDSAARELEGEEADRRERAALLIAFANGVALARMIAPDQISLDAAERGMRRLVGRE
jgi:AcrR family transcriptional regulator